jgi:hypothetical protein
VVSSSHNARGHAWSAALLVSSSSFLFEAVEDESESHIDRYKCCTAQTAIARKRTGRGGVLASL